MSKRGNKPGQPTHMNVYKFEHNPNSRLTARIMSIHHTNLCERCEKQIEYKKTYRKYKPLNEVNRCVACHEPSIKRAYHIICDKCSKDRGACAKCLKPCDAAKRPPPVTDQVRGPSFLHRDIYQCLDIKLCLFGVYNLYTVVIVCLISSFAPLDVIFPIMFVFLFGIRF